MHTVAEYKFVKYVNGMCFYGNQYLHKWCLFQYMLVWKKVHENKSLFYSTLFKQYHVCKKAEWLSTTAQNYQFGIDCLYPIVL